MFGDFFDPFLPQQRVRRGYNPYFENSFFPEDEEIQDPFHFRREPFNRRRNRQENEEESSQTGSQRPTSRGEYDNQRKQRSNDTEDSEVDELRKKLMHQKLEDEEEQLKKQFIAQKLCEEEEQERENKKRQEFISRPEVREKAATDIQAKYRGWKTRRNNPLDRLRSLKKVNEEIDAILERNVQLQQMINKEIDIESYSATEKLIKVYEEELTIQLLALDSIESGGYENVRTYRKRIVARIQNLLEMCKSLKKKIEHKIKIDQKKKEAAEQAEQARMKEDLKREATKKAEDKVNKCDNCENLQRIIDDLRLTLQKQNEMINQKKKKGNQRKVNRTGREVQEVM